MCRATNSSQLADRLSELQLQECSKGASSPKQLQQHVTCLRQQQHHQQHGDRRRQQRHTQHRQQQLQQRREQKQRHVLLGRVDHSNSTARDL